MEISPFMHDAANYKSPFWGFPSHPSTLEIKPRTLQNSDLAKIGAAFRNSKLDWAIRQKMAGKI